MPQAKELAAAKLLLGGSRGLRTEVSLAEKVEPRVMLMLAHDLLAALEQKGYLSPAVAQSRTVIRGQLAAWGVITCIRQATTASQIIHTRSRTKASTIAIVSVREKPSEPTTQPCTR
jgi:hypothetical protein